ncbi:rCG37081 [Rattus norvegicus]|uniref:RCG37081 n=1 Tax=Rattus norvegicus TaxID=10116 RepID=A6HU97_RAT|nr:rCG37081 [Rattus norvegicus]
MSHSVWARFGDGSWLSLSVGNQDGSLSLEGRGVMKTSIELRSSGLGGRGLYPLSHLSGTRLCCC